VSHDKLFYEVYADNFLLLSESIVPFKRSLWALIGGTVLHLETERTDVCFYVWVPTWTSISGQARPSCRSPRRCNAPLQSILHAAKSSHFSVECY